MMFLELSTYLWNVAPMKNDFKNLEASTFEFLKTLQERFIKHCQYTLTSLRSSRKFYRYMSFVLNTEYYVDVSNTLYQFKYINMKRISQYPIKVD